MAERCEVVNYANAIALTCERDATHTLHDSGGIIAVVCPLHAREWTRSVLGGLYRADPIPAHRDATGDTP